MSSSIDSIIAELISLEPGLREHETKLRELVKLMVANKPASVLDEDFRRELRTKIDRKIRTMRNEQTKKSVSFSWLVPFLFGGAVFAALMVVSPIGQYLRDAITPTKTIEAPTMGDLAMRTKEPAPESIPTEQGTPESATTPDARTTIASPTETKTTNNTPSSGRPTSTRTETPSSRPNIIAFGTDIRKVAPNAFGKIPSTQAQTFGKWGGWVESLAMPTADTDNKVAAPNASPGADLSILPYHPTIYRYAYTGATIAIPETLPVFRKESKRLESEDIQSLLSSLRFSLLDLSTLSSLRLDSMNLSEDREYGLSTNIDLAAGSIWMSKNWTRWPQSKCQTEECFAKERVKISDVPDDAALIRLAEAFVREHRVDTGKYDKPIVRHDWKIEYARSSDANTAYIPETMYVVYPLQINGYDVYEEYGAQKWLNIGIDIKTKRVSEFTGLEYLPLLASDYSTDQDFEHLRTLVNTELNTLDTSSEASKKDIALRTPEIVYIRTTRMIDGQSSEYLIPTLRFESVSQPSAGEYFQTNLFVPLVSDFQTKN